VSWPVEEMKTRRGCGSKLLTAATVLVAAVAVVLGILWLIPRNEYLLLPGQALDVETMISIPGHPNPATAGHLYMTDVTLYKVDHLVEELYGRFRSDGDLEPAPAVTGTLSDKQFNQLNTQLMSSSIQSAEAAALELIPGYRPRYSSTGPKIIFIVPGTPAAKALKVGDVLEAVNGHRTLRAIQVGPLIRRVHPGDSVRLLILRHGKLITISVRTVPSKNGQPDKNGKTALVGIEAQDQIIFPVKMSINPGDIGGPSAGLMFSLGIVQRLDGKDLTHGCQIAGTGTIDAAGNVGEIGGAKQKIIAARQRGAQYFLVPNVSANVAPARGNRGGITVVPVKTLKQALLFLQHLKPCR
jgi:Lon-like protease